MINYFKDWYPIIDLPILMQTMDKLNLKYSKASILPEKSEVLRAFNLCPYKDLKVVLIGQDPYPQKGVATGLAFGNKRGTSVLSPSLELIKEASINFTIPKGVVEFDETLESWAKQGVLLLNSALTVEENKIGSHTLIWRPFVTSLIEKLSEVNSGIIYVLFGKQAQSYIPYINANSNYIIKSLHPAYYARLGMAMPCDCFEKVNDILMKNHGTTIKWYQQI